MKTISITISLLLFTTVVNSAEIISTEEYASAKVFNVRCDNGKSIAITYRYPNETYAVAGRYFNMYRHAVAFGCK